MIGSSPTPWLSRLHDQQLGLPHVTEPGYSAYATMKGGLIVLPRYLEQHVTGYGLFKLGAGVNFTATKLLDPSAFGSALVRLLSDPMPASRAVVRQ